MSSPELVQGKLQFKPETPTIESIRAEYPDMHKYGDRVLQNVIKFMKENNLSDAKKAIRVMRGQETLPPHQDQTGIPS